MHVQGVTRVKRGRMEENKRIVFTCKNNIGHFQATDGVLLCVCILVLCSVRVFVSFSFAFRAFCTFFGVFPSMHFKVVLRTLCAYSGHKLQLASNYQEIKQKQKCRKLSSLTTTLNVFFFLFAPFISEVFVRNWCVFSRLSAPCVL